MAASPGSGDGAAAVVCCMCGDHGLPRELFRCKLCRLRSQHRYCSELYPRVTAYRRCNWCLREDGGGGGSPVRQPNTEAKRRRMSASTSEMNNSGEDNRDGCSRTAFSVEPRKPVKKPKCAGDDERAAAATKGGKKLQAAAGKARFRVKVRRYKLLADVIISC